MKWSDNMQNKPKNKQMLNKKNPETEVHIGMKGGPVTRWNQVTIIYCSVPSLLPVVAAVPMKTSSKQTEQRTGSVSPPVCVSVCVSVQKGNEMAGHTVGFAPALLTMTIWTERRWDHRGILSWHRVRVCFHAGKPTQLFTCVWIPHEDGRILAKDSCPEPPVIRLTLAEIYIGFKHRVCVIKGW